LNRIIRKIRLASYKSSIQERPLREILEDCTEDDDEKIPQATINLIKFFKLRYFLLNEDSESFQLLDSLKVICFLILFSKDKQDK
jgi:hypothetical protein